MFRIKLLFRKVKRKLKRMSLLKQNKKKIVRAKKRSLTT